MKTNVLLLLVGTIAATRSTLLLEAPNQMPVHSLVNTETDEVRMKTSKTKGTMLTIVQDFPKKEAVHTGKDIVMIQ